MFNKLKIRLISINMSLLTVVFISIFGLIYFMTNASLNRDINMNLNSIMVNNKPKPGYSNIVIDTNENGQIIKSLVPFNISINHNDLQDITNEILKNKKVSDKITISNENYVFLKNTYHKNMTKIALLNITYVENLKIFLLKIFIFVGIMSLIVLFFISVYLTNKSIKPIKDVFEKQKQFIADASHELKTPLTIIKTNTSLLLSSPDDTINNQKKWLNYINMQTNRMSELINEMLTLAKLDTENNKLSMSNINISNIVESMILQFDAIVYENNINLETNISNNIFINGNIESLKKLLSIIIDNAIKHTNSNGIISINLYLEKNIVKLSVENTGKGISPENLQKIFERFYRADSSRTRDTGRYGLGLSIAKSIVEQHKGKIYAKSTPNQSTTFFIELPIKFQNFPIYAKIVSNTLLHRRV